MCLHVHVLLLVLRFKFHVLRPYVSVFMAAPLSLGVQCAAVSVICELARKHPKNYLSLAPTFFKLMSNSTNNWMLIKIIKLVCVCVCVCHCVCV